MISKKSIFPSVFTALNIFCGFLCVINVADGHFIAAAWLVVLAAIFDALDGKVARLTKSSSNFGVEVDSLADVVSFGLAPAILIYKVYFFRMGTLGLLLSFFPLIFGAMRLARFNVQFTDHPKKYYVGLSIPMAAITLSTYVIFGYDPSAGLQFARFFPPLVILVSLLMISTVEYEPLPEFSLKRDRKNLLKLLVLFASVVLIGIFPKTAFFFLIMGYIFLGLGRWIHILIKGEEATEFSFSNPLEEDLHRG